MSLFYPDAGATAAATGESYWDVLVEVGDERRRQISKGYSAVSDDAYVDRELARAAGAYALNAACQVAAGQVFYPWPGRDWTPEHHRAALIRAAALAVAEIERLDRLSAQEPV